MGALTSLDEEERMFQTAVRQFARDEVAPHVRQMDEAGLFRKDLLDQMFRLGLMAIEVPEEYGGPGGEASRPTAHPASTPQTYMASWGSNLPD